MDAGTVYSITQIIRMGVELMELMAQDDMSEEELDRRMESMRASLAQTIDAWRAAAKVRNTHS